MNRASDGCEYGVRFSLSYDIFIRKNKCFSLLEILSTSSTFLYSHTNNSHEICAVLGYYVA